MSTKPALRLLVLSDLHAHTEEPDGGGGTSLSFHGDASGVEKMFGGIRTALDTAGMGEVDAVICPGDLTDKCDPTALAQVWRRLVDLADDLGATLVATAGNHDHDSRAHDGYDPRKYLKDLAPAFPVRDDTERMRYFADNYARTSVSGHTVVALNTGALGGQQGPDGEEYQHGRVQAGDMARLTADLRDAPAAGVRVLVVHHHPVQLPSVDLNERSIIRDVELLLEVLSNDGQWLVIHGHKHRPWIQYAPGGGGSPVLFSAGSFGAPLDGVLAQSTKNQFYLVDVIAEADAHELDLGVAGTFHAWSHNPIGLPAWVPSGSTDGLPARGGFGWRADPARLGRRAIEFVKGLGRDCEWAELVAWESRLPYLSPSDLRSLAVAVSRSAAAVDLKFDTDGRLARATLHVVAAGVQQ